jgi:MFS transporter, FHS family, L-fucose permease
MINKSAKPDTYILPLIMIMGLMFFWNLSRNINDILIPHLKRACQLSDFQSSLIQSAFFGAYFLVALPVGKFIERFGYKAGMIAGLFIAAGGALLFYPAAETRIYPVFLIALFIMASGFTFLEVTATPYIANLGPAHSSSGRLSMSAAVGSLGATIGPYLGASLLLHEQEQTPETILSFSSEQLKHFLAAEASLVKLPYMLLAGLFCCMAVLCLFVKFPHVQEENKTDKKSFASIFQFSHTLYGVLAVFCYLGAEVGIVSFMIRYSKSLNIAGLTEKDAALFITAYMALVLAGRLAGAILLKRLNPAKVLAFCTIAAIAFLLLAIVTTGYFSLVSLSCIGLFTSIMYPVIFTLSIRELGPYTKTASSLLIMGIVGGALVPPVMGYISDLSEIKYAFLIPFLCYIYVLFFAKKGYMVKQEVTVV